MSDKNKNVPTESRRNLLKLAATGLLAGMIAPLVDLNAPLAAGSALQGKKVLTVYYSWTGNTRSMAAIINEMVGGDMVGIETGAPYPTEYRETTKQARADWAKQLPMCAIYAPRLRHCRARPCGETRPANLAKRLQTGCAV